MPKGLNSIPNFGGTAVRKRILIIPSASNESARFCACGKPSHPQYGNRCEDCFVDGFSRCATDAYSDKPEIRSGSLPELVADLNLPQRTLNSLERSGITTIAQLINRSGNQILMVRHIGEGGLRHIIEKLSEHGLKLRRG